MIAIVAHEDHFAWLGNFQAYLKSLGHVVVPLPGTKTNEQYRNVVTSPECEHVFMWNGTLPHHFYIKKICGLHNKTYSILEVGFFPQKEFYIIDNKGINAESSMMDMKLSVTEKDEIAYEAFREKYVAGRTWRQTNQYILVPMQLELDSNIRLHSPLKTMQALIDHVEAEFPKKKIIFKRHPKDKNTYRISPKNEFMTGGHILEVSQDAEMVYGINSTCLLETSMMGVPTVAIGNGFLKAHADNVRNLLIYLCKRQIPIVATDLKKWFEMIFPNFPKNFKPI
jgi:hypothetical protein